MSQETMEWLNTQTLIGFTDKRGNAWHYQAVLQGDEPNHYAGAIPIADVERRLFNWKAVKQPVFIKVGDAYVAVKDKNAIVADDDESGNVLGIFSTGYEPHQYKDWLLRNVATILDDELGIGSAGLLRDRGQAWVSVEVSENIKTPEGVEFRPNLIAATSFDGSLSTTYARAVTNVVCDNTLNAGLSEKDQQFKLRHTKYSKLRIADAREALKIVYETKDEFEAEVTRLCSVDVTEKVWKAVLDQFNPIPEAEGRGRTLAEHKRAELLRLYAHDDRVAPWAGTAFGVLQAFNTYSHHFGTVRGASRVQRNREAAISGRFANNDAKVVEATLALAAA